MFDQDDSGSVSYDELAKIVRGLGQNPTEKELEEMFKQLDGDGMRIKNFDIYGFSLYLIVLAQ